MYNFDEFKVDIENSKEKGLYVNIRNLFSAQGAWLNVDGKKVLNMCSNNYLGLADDNELKKAAIQGIEKWGVGPGAVRTIAGTMEIHNILENKLAEFKGVEATIVLQSGFTANQAVIPVVAGKEDAILSDKLNHASIIDGVRLTKAKRYVWEHRDPNDLRKKLEEAKNDGAKKLLVITDGVFSMDGDLAPLPDLAEVCEEFNAILMVDDAHGEGVLGSHGRGIVDHFNLHGKVDIEVGTLSKAFGIVGGFVAGKKNLIDYLKQKARPFLFSSSLSPAETAAGIAAVEKLSRSDELVKKLWSNAEYFKKKLIKLGFDCGHSETPITPVMLYDAKLSSEFSKKLYDEGIFASSIGFPTVPRGEARIRVMISAAHTKEDLDFAVEKFESVGKDLNVIK
ncbi:MAG: glycine C-acetyltransferase [Kosmotogales bacterium]|nr:glycine C-acetyltransferase [Kosmotogales bacterium]